MFMNSSMMGGEIVNDTNRKFIYQKRCDYRKGLEVRRKEDRLKFPVNLSAFRALLPKSMDLETPTFQSEDTFAQRVKQKRKEQQIEHFKSKV